MAISSLDSDPDDLRLCMSAIKLVQSAGAPVQPVCNTIYEEWLCRPCAGHILTFQVQVVYFLSDCMNAGWEGKEKKAEAKTGRAGKRNFNGTEFKHRKSSRRHPACSNYFVNAALSASFESAISQQCTVISGRVWCGEWVAQTLAWMWLSITVAWPGALLWARLQLINQATVSPRRLQSPKLQGVKCGPAFLTLCSQSGPMSSGSRLDTVLSGNIAPLLHYNPPPARRSLHGVWQWEKVEKDFTQRPSQQVSSVTFLSKRYQHNRR